MIKLNENYNGLKDSYLFRGISSKIPTKRFTD